MGTDYYRLVLSTISELYNLRVIDEQEKSMLKDIVINGKPITKHPESIEAITHAILHRLQKYRTLNSRKSNSVSELASIEEETDEE